jgi:hypothetical protein
MSVLKAVFTTLPHVHESRRRPYEPLHPCQWKRHLTRRRLPPFSSCPWSRFCLREVTANCLHLRAGSRIRALALSGNVRNTACNTELSVSVNIYWQEHCRARCVNGWIWNTGEMIWQSSATVNLVQMPLCSPQIPLWFHSEAYERLVAKHLSRGMAKIRL